MDMLTRDKNEFSYASMLMLQLDGVSR